jgi:hypothetical protein
VFQFGEYLRIAKEGRWVMENLTSGEDLTESQPEEFLPKVKILLAPQINFAYHQNSIPLI